MITNKRPLILLLLLLAVSASQAQVRLARFFGDGMVLQRHAPIPVWGWASPGERITVAFDGRRYRTTATADSSWRLELPAMQAGGPYVMVVSGKNTLELHNILIGDLWLCAGQSNMVHQLDIHDVTYADEIARADYPAIRHFKVPTANSLTGPAADLPGGTWQAAVGESVRPFSAVAYFFAKQLYDRYHVPIGLINASVGGTPIEAWTPEVGFEALPEVLRIIQENKDTAFVGNQLRSRPAFDRSRPEDQGLADDPPWYAETITARGWRTINIPGYWEDQGARDLDGVVWYRRTIDLPPAMAGQAARVFLGRIVDADELYINGTRVGGTTYQYPQRRYAVPAGLLRAGSNVFAIRVSNYGGKGGFVPDKPYCLFAGSDTVDLKGYWQYKVGAVFAPPGVSARTGGTRLVNPQQEPAALYNAMVAPLASLSLTGVLWYQGESNAGRPGNYEALMRALVGGWRTVFRDPALPFIYAQLPNFMDVAYLPGESNWAALREAQRKALDIPHTAMTVNIDLGEWNDIHPDNKRDVGERMALAARKLAYGEDLVYAGPLYQSHTIEGDTIVLSFAHTGSGLVTADGEALRTFAIAGADRKFVWAHATIAGSTVRVWSESMPKPRYVRYAWADNPDNPNLRNREGLPASPFQTE